MNKLLITLLSAVAMNMAVTPLYAHEDGTFSQGDKTLFDDYRPQRLLLDMSLAIHMMALEVKDKKTNTLQGKFESVGPTFILNLQTADTFFGTSHFGYNISAGLNGYCMNEQLYDDPATAGTESERTNLGTSVNGVFAYLTPTLFYNFGTKRLHAQAGDAFRIGVGVGIGYLSTSGSVQFTETTGAEHTFDESSFGLAYNLLLEYRSGRLVSRLKASGPTINGGDYQYSLNDTYISIGYLIDI